MLSFKKLSSIVPTKDRCPQGEFYTGENVQPQSFQINCCVNISIDHQIILLVPIVSNPTIGENNFIPIAHIEV